MYEETATLHEQANSAIQVEGVPVSDDTATEAPDTRGTATIPTDTEWWTVNEACIQLGVAPKTLQKHMDELLTERPDWRSEQPNRANRIQPHIHRDLLVAISESRNHVPDAPDGWRTIGGLARDMGVSHVTISRLLDKRGLSDEDTATFTDKGNNVRMFISPSVAQELRAQLTVRRQRPPKGWISLLQLSQDLGLDRQTITAIIEPQLQSNPELVGYFMVNKKPETRCLDPQLVELVRVEAAGRQEPPEGWITATALAIETGKDLETVRRRISLLSEEHPDDRGTYQKRGGVRTEYISPVLAAKINDEFSQLVMPPSGWASRTQAQKTFRRPKQTIAAVAESFRDSHPEWFGVFSGRQGMAVEHYSPDLIEAIAEIFEQRSSIPPGWTSLADLETGIGAGETRIQALLKQYRKSNPEWFDRYDNHRGQLCDHISPELSEIIRERLAQSLAPEGWQARTTIRRQFGIGTQTFHQLVSEMLSEHPEWAVKYPNKGRLVTYYSPELQERLKSYEEAYAEAVPEGWQTTAALVKKFGSGWATINDIADRYEPENPEWFGVFKVKGYKGPVRCFSPELCSLIESELGTRQEKASNKARLLKKDAGNFLEGLSQGTIVEAEQFHKLTRLLGAERTLDILYQFRPEYRKIPVPYVRSVIADYLGDFMNVRGELNLETIAEVEGFLSDKNLRDGLIEVVKDSCLRHYNLTIRSGQEASLGIVLEYIGSLRLHGSDLENDQFIGVLDEVEAYYRAAFESIALPGNIVDALRQDRLFPDLNQRINIKEITEKHKMLIADEMGVGKSASAILAKEHLGVRQALVVAPSNVIDTWLRYLSSEPGNDEYPAGYFKPGQEPSVLNVESLDQLEGDLSQYDYVLLSQERLNKRYVAALAKLDYGMLIVDEAHKLKNLKGGKRADMLVALASRIEGDDKYLALLSGTPVPNKVGDVAMILKLLYPEKFADVDNRELVRQIIKGDALDLRSLLVPRMEMKSLAESVPMPDLTEIEHKIPLSAEEQVIYEMLVDEDELTASQKLQLLRQFVMNPNLIELAPDVPNSKLQAVAGQLRKTFAEKDKIVMFVNGYVEGVIRGDQTILDQLDLPDGVKVLAIHRDVSKEERAAIEAQLRTSGQKILLAVSGQTADVGVDFSGADEVFFYNEPWTKYDKKQQLGRVYRPGLQAGLISRTFVADDTIEEGINKYIESKYQAIEKLLRGIPLSEIERELVRHDEQADPDLEVDANLADYYFSSWDRMMQIYKYVKEMGEENFTHFLGRYGQEYAECYADLGSRSYQANASRLSGTVLKKMVDVKKQNAEDLHILDIASGPEMLRHHATKPISDRVFSVDINQHHFSAEGQKRAVGSFLRLPIASGSMDYANLSLALHYTNFLPSKGNYERLELLRELNRVLKVGGSGIINMMYTLDFKSLEGFREVAEKTGFKIVEKYSGEVESGQHFRTRMITLEKVRDCTESAGEIIKQLSPSSIKGLKLKRLPSKVRDSRKIVTDFVLNGSTTLKAQFNEEDREVLDEEQLILKQMNMLRKRYGGVKNIPVIQIKAGGFARFFNGKSYVLFKRLATAGGAVIIR